MANKNIYFKLYIAGIILVIIGLITAVSIYIKGKKEHFHFEVTPEKKCRLFPYIWSDECAQLAKEGKLTGQYLCGGDYASCNITGYPSHMFVGFPKHFEYTPESNADWENERCSDPVYDWMPSVL